MRRTPPLLLVLVAATLILTAVDHWTTYVCLRAPVSGWQVTEANPLAAWLFASVGLLPGILLDSIATLVAVGCLVVTGLVPQWAKQGFFVIVASATGWAVFNNLQAISRMGLWPLGGA